MSYELEQFRKVPRGEEGHPRGSCDSCGLYIFSDGGYEIPGLREASGRASIFCSLPCIESAIATKTGSTKKITAAPIGSGARLVLWLKTHPLTPSENSAIGEAKLGRPTVNGHPMSTSERKRRQREMSRK